MNIETKTCLANAYRDAWNADLVEGSVMYIERTVTDAPVYKSIRTKCANNWREDYAMQEFCSKDQAEVWRVINE